MQFLSFFLSLNFCIYSKKTLSILKLLSKTLWFGLLNFYFNCISTSDNFCLIFVWTIFYSKLKIGFGYWQMLFYLVWYQFGFDCISTPDNSFLCRINNRDLCVLKFDINLVSYCSLKKQFNEFSHQFTPEIHILIYSFLLAFKNSKIEWEFF